MENKENIRKYSDKELFKKLAIYIKPVISKFILALIMVLLIIGLDLLPSILTGAVVNILSGNKSMFDFLGNNPKTVITILTLSFFCVLVISTSINYLYQMILQHIGQDMIFKVREDTFNHIESLTIGQINKEPIGKLVTRVTNDTNALSDLFTNVIVLLIKYILTIIVIYIVMWVISPKLTLFISLILPIIIISSYLFRKISRKAYRNVRNSVSVMNSYLSENISGMKVTQIFNQEEKKYKEFKEKNLALKKANLTQIFVFSIFRPLMYFLFVLCVIITLYFGSIEVSKGSIAVGTLVTYYSLVNQFFNPIENLAEQFNQLQSALASCEKIFTVLDTEVDIKDSSCARNVGKLKGKIEFKNVWFSYNPGVWILKDVSFVVEAGQTCAFVGATGAGKTTILSLICRNYEFQRGQILIDDIDIRDIEISSLRENIGQMLQDVFLFSGTIRDNITIYDNKFSDEQIMEACKYVNADRLINKYDDKLDHNVEERGVNYSSGERQLISFARTILYKPNIMILDEATANIDTETEKVIQDSLEKMMNVGTMLIVAHRLSTIQHADKIVVLKHGEIVEEGNHQELLKKKGMYYNLYLLQYKNMENEN
ncbi:MAG: ABC transporter ATP-binding protein/permease [Acholeplasmatales bacterium]|nr:ABC transporter ATP-binding protein/permease [Acholeplasmatales bacterium]